MISICSGPDTRTMISPSQIFLPDSTTDQSLQNVADCPASVASGPSLALRLCPHPLRNQLRSGPFVVTKLQLSQALCMSSFQLGGCEAELTAFEVPYVCIDVYINPVLNVLDS